MAEAVGNREDILEVSEETVEQLKKRALESPLGRFRLLMHHSANARVQEMVTVFRRGSYLRPHRHPGGKTESYHVIEGELLVIFFDDEGKVQRRIELAARGAGKPFLYRLSSNKWHMPIPRSPVVVMQEVFQGPFDKDRDVQYAAWSPRDDDEAAVQSYVKKLEEG